VLAVSLFIVFLAWIVGPSGPARGIRSLTARGVRAIGGAGSKAGATATDGVNTGAAGSFAKERLVMLRVGIVAVALLLFAVADHPSAGYVVTLLVIAVVAWLAVEFLARTAPADAVAAGAETPATPAGETGITEPVPETVATATAPAGADPTTVTVPSGAATARTIELDVEPSRESAGHGTSGG
jgi:hypothetical protein